MAPPAALAPLTSTATLRRGVILVLGGVVAAAYGLLGVGFAQMYADPALSASVTTALLAVTAAIVLLPPFLHPVRSLEAAAARTLLDVELPQSSGRGASATARGALWFLLHLATGAIAALSLLTAIPLAVSLVAWHLGATALEDAIGRLAGLPEPVAALAALVLLLVPPYAMWGLGALLRAAAPRLLGPSAQERIARLEADKRDLAARNALARDLHDSVGHALTVTTLQAAAAERALDRDPEFARSALAAIARTGRDAVAELDRVLGILRAGAPPSAAAAATHDRTLRDVGALVEDARGTGAEVTVTLPRGFDGLPPAVSREGYGILREAMTNALRHGDGRVDVVVALSDGHVDLTVSNGLRAATAEGGPGDAGMGGPERGLTGLRAQQRGLSGMRDRATVLGGELTWGPRDGKWVVYARLPVEVP